MLQLLRHLHQELPRACKGKKLGATPPWYVQLRSFILVHTFCMKVISHDNFGTLLENLVLCRCSCALVFHTDNGWGSYTGHSEWCSGGCSCVLSWCDSHKFSCLRQVSPKQIIFFIIIVLMVLAFLILFFSSFGVFAEQLQNEGLKLDLTNQPEYFPLMGSLQSWSFGHPSHRYADKRWSDYAWDAGICNRFALYSWNLKRQDKLPQVCIWHD